MANEEAINDFPAALRALRHPEFLKTPKYNGQQWRAERSGADPDILEFERAFLARMTKLGIPFFALHVVRTYEEQMGLFLAKTSRDSPEDGIWPHQEGAVDLIHSIDGYELHRVQWDAVGHIGKEVAQAIGIPITWGGDFRSIYDPAHWELQNWKQRLRCEHERKTAVVNGELKVYPHCFKCRKPLP